MFDCIYNLQVCHLHFQVCHRTKYNSFKSGHIYRKDAHCSETDFLVHEFFCATFSFWDMNEFVFGRLHHFSFGAGWHSMHVKPTTSKTDHISKIKVAQKNSWTKKSVSEHCASFLKIWPLSNKILVTRWWFRNAKQWYPITDWFGRFNSKASGAWGWSLQWEAKPPSETRGLGERSSPNIFFSEFLEN